MKSEKTSAETSLKNIPKESHDADIIMSVPETGDDSAMGVHEQSGLTLGTGIKAAPLCHRTGLHTS